MATLERDEIYTEKEHGMQSNRIPLKVYHRSHSNERPVPVHSHNFWEIVFVLSGSGRHIIHLPDGEENVFRIKEHSVFMLAPGQKHEFAFEQGEKTEIINILFNPLIVNRLEITNWDDMSAFNFIHTYPYVSAANQQQFSIVLSPEEKQYCLDLIARLEEEMKHKSLGYNTMSQLYFSIILTKLIRCYYIHFGNTPTQAPDCVSKVIQYIAGNYNREITLQMLSEYTHFSTRHLTRKFKDTMQLSVAEYILSLRMSNAKAMLQSTDKKIEEIAFANGFSDASYFSKQFREITGKTPREYRKDIRALASKDSPDA